MMYIGNLLISVLYPLLNLRIRPRRERVGRIGNK